MWPTIRKTGGFGLIELLIVVGLIVVLSFLSFTALKSVRLQADTSRCINNLRTLSVAMNHYTNDNNGFLLEDEVPRESDGVRVLWPHKLNTYLNTDFSRISVNPVLVKSTPLHCPAEKELVRPYSCYSINREFNRRLFNDTSRIHFTGIVSPSKYVLMADSSTSSIIYSDTAKKMREFTKIDRRHNGRPNFLFADGHVESWSRPLIGLDDAGGKTPENRAMWQARYRP